MRLLLGAVAALVSLAPAWAQTPTQPLAPPSLRPPAVQTPSTEPPNVVPVPPPAAGTEQPAPAPGTEPPATTPGEEPAAPAPPANVWLPGAVADLVALDKVSARPTHLTVRVGQSVQFGSLTIAVRACVFRPPDQPADSAVLLDITDSHPGGPGFHGWMIVSAPSVSMLQHPIYDVRPVDCHE